MQRLSLSDPEQRTGCADGSQHDPADSSAITHRRRAAAETGKWWGGREITRELGGQ